MSGLVAFAPSARAQSEIDPDHFGSPNTESVQPAKTDVSSEAAGIHYNGKFTLPYSVQCRGKNLHPGKWSVSFRSDGKVGLATLSQEGQSIGIGGIVYRQAHKRGSDALVVERKGRARRLAALQVAELYLILDREWQIEDSSNSKRERTDRLLLTQTVQKSDEKRKIPLAPNGRQ